MTKKLTMVWAVGLTITVMVLLTYTLYLHIQVQKISLTQNSLQSIVARLIDYSIKQTNYINKLMDTINLQQSKIKELEEKTVCKRVIYATITSYSPRVQECDNTPYTTAFMKKVHPKYVAVSRDIVKKLRWAPGQKIYIEGIGVRIIGDFMSPKIKGYHIDLFMWNTRDAKKFGKRKNVLVVLLDDLINS